MPSGKQNTSKFSQYTAPKLAEQNRLELIAVHAFFLAEEHGSERYDWHDWQEAEREIDAVIETAK